MALLSGVDCIQAIIHIHGVHNYLYTYFITTTNCQRRKLAYYSICFMSVVPNLGSTDGSRGSTSSQNLYYGHLVFAIGRAGLRYVEGPKLNECQRPYPMSFIGCN